MISTRPLHDLCLIFFLISLLLPATLKAACSPYLSHATINEVHNKGDSEHFVEVKILNGTIPASIYNDWTLTIWNNDAAISQGQILLSADTSTQKLPWLVIGSESNNDISDPIGDNTLIELNEGMDIILKDSLGRTIDYLSINGSITHSDTTCTPAFDWQWSYDTNTSGSHTLKRITDGVGDWAADPGGKIPPTDGDTNDILPTPPQGETYPLVTVDSLLITPGQPATFTISFEGSATFSQDVTVNYTTGDLTATSRGGDYTATSGSILIPTLSNSATVTVNTSSTALAGEEFYLMLTSIANSSANDDMPNAIITNHFGLGHFTRPTAAAYYAISHDGTGITCNTEDITITACQDAPCLTQYTGTVELTLTAYGNTSGTTDSIPLSFSGGSTTYALRHTTPEIVTLDINGPPPATNAKTCLNTSTAAASCDITFYEAGFLFDVPPQKACQTSANVTISAVRTDLTTQRCVPGFISRSEDVFFWSTYVTPLTGTEAVQINNTTIATATPGTAISLTFDANGESTFDVTYDDAGNIQLNAHFDGSGTETGLVMLGSDTFVVKPAHFLLAATKNDGTTALNNTTSDGTPIEAAGNDFRITAQAVCADNITVTQNYIPTNAQIWIQRTGPTAVGSEGTLTFPNLTTPTNYTTSLAASPFWNNNVSTSFVNGMIADSTVTYATANYSEVGLITLHLRDTNYLGETIAENTIDIGRFTPHHFSIDISPAPPLFTDACIAGNYSYLGEPFPFATPPTITITAVNGAPTPAITQNYDCGGFWKFAAPMDLAYSYTDSSGNSLGLTPAANTINPLAGDSSDCNGTAQLTLTDTITYARPAMSSPRGPFPASVDLVITATQLTDNDLVCYDTGSGCQGFSQDAITGTSLRHGIIQVFNNFGPETMDITHSPFAAHYYDGTSWVANTEDECSTALTFCSSPVADRIAPLSIQPTPLSGGLGTFTASTAGTFGETIDVCPTAPAWLSETDCTAPDLTCGTFTFGIYRGNDRIINWQEVIQ